MQEQPPPTPLCCPECSLAFLPDDVNVGTNVAYCRACNRAHPLSTLAGAEEGQAQAWRDPEERRLEDRLAAVDLQSPPDGAWYRDDGLEVVVGASMRSVGGAIGALFFGLFWNGIVSVFVLVAIAGTMKHLGVKLPTWFPAPMMQGGSSMPLGMVVFLWIFLIPFIMVGLVMVGAFVSCVAGHMEVRVRDAEGTIFVGIGRIGYRRRFDASGVTEVHVMDKRWRDSDGDSRRRTEIAIEGVKTVRFASSLTEERRIFVVAALRKMLLD